MSEKKIKDHVGIIKDSERIIRDKNGYQPVAGLINEKAPTGGSGVPPLNSSNEKKVESENKK